MVDAQDDIWSEFSNKHTIPSTPRDLLIIGALESAFKEMDQLIAEDRNKYQAAGGCTALVTLFILGRVYVANAGDSRAVICKGETTMPMSVDFNPENERERIRKLAAEQPALLGMIILDNNLFSIFYQSSFHSSLCFATIHFFFDHPRLFFLLPCSTKLVFSALSIL